MEHNHEFEGGHEHRHDHDHGPEHSKYEEALAKYNIRLRDEDVKAKTALLIEKHVAENNTPDVKKFLFHCIDLTTLKWSGQCNGTGISLRPVYCFLLHVFR